MKTTWIVMLCLSFAACATQQVTEEVSFPPQLRAVVTNYDSNGARLQCVLDTWEPVGHVWQSIVVTDAQSGKVLAHSVLQQMENLLSADKAESTEQDLLTGTEKHSQQEARAYISTAQLYVADVDKSSHIRLSIAIGNERIQKDLR